VLSYGLVPALLFHNAVLPPELAMVPAWMTPATSLFLHADFMHLAGNMLFLWVFADNVEDAMGHARFVLFYFACGIAAGLAFAIMDPAAELPLIGASGAISGALASYVMLHPRAKVWVLAFGRIPVRLPSVWLIGAWLLFQIISAVLAPKDVVAWWAHLGGFAMGLVLTPFLKRPEVALFASPTGEAAMPAQIQPAERSDR
jgi:membrane associated rhomboid family serine protease